jgi:hypothetical protein
MGGRGHGWIRGVIMAGTLASLWMLGAGGPATADNPEPCGHLRYSTSTGPTTTVTFGDYCERPCGADSIGMGIPPGHVGTALSWEGFVCVRHVDQ